MISQSRHTLPAHKAPQQQWLRLALDDRIEIVHSAGGDGDTARTTLAVQGYILAPAVEVHPPGLVNHQCSAIGRLIVYVHALQAKSTLVASAMFLRCFRHQDHASHRCWPQFSASDSPTHRGGACRRAPNSQQTMHSARSCYGDGRTPKPCLPAPQWFYTPVGRATQASRSISMPNADRM